MGYFCFKLAILIYHNSNAIFFIYMYSIKSLDFMFICYLHSFEECFSSNQYLSLSPGAGDICGSREIQNWYPLGA